MKIEVIKANELVYSQTFDDTRTLNGVIAHLMEQPRGNSFSVTVTSNGHPLYVGLDTLNLRELTLIANGPSPRKRASSRETSAGTA